MADERRLLSACICALVVFALSIDAWAEQGLTNCAEQFPGASTTNAPAVAATVSTPASGNVQVCRRSGNASFFALEYDPQRYAPLWVAYRIADTFGEGGCASMTRGDMQCHFKADNVAACRKSKKGAPDPFHSDPLLAALKKPRLGTGAFGGTGHDRGHMAPNNAFSWHACGAYKTFTMANMAAQWGSLNRALWANLEAQVLFWGVKTGPVYVATGPIWKRFPAERFKAIQEGLVDAKRFAKSGERLVKLDGKKLSQNIPRPTGFYMVVFSPGTADQPGRAIAFLAPHTKQEKLSFWYFLATVTLVEEASGLRFGFADEFKQWPDLSYWQALGHKAPSGWDIRGGCKTKPAEPPVPGWMADRPVKERIAMCSSSDPVN